MTEKKINGYNDYERHSKEDALAILANCNTKIFLKLDGNNSKLNQNSYTGSKNVKIFMKLEDPEIISETKKII